MGRRILVVEDDPEIVRLMHKILGPQYDMEFAGNGLEALERLEHDPLPDLLIVDVMMPKLDGLTLLRTLKNSPRTARIRAIIVSARGAPRDVIDGINVGVKHYLVKPFKVDDLLAKVAKILA
jgi:CheY-like chemotaxis protein